ncbi:MAG: hypothetical protein L3J44_01710 [Campylobacteraceae bacterium]|nr:hypothetical protein [Campylobacteraceae bacterium]
MKIAAKMVVLIALGSVLFAGSEVPFPADFANYKQASTPLTHIGALPGCDADVSSLPKIYQETVATYCNIKPGGPGKVDVLVKPSAMSIYKKRDGKFKDGDTLILWLKDIKAIFVTTYKGGKPLYGAYTEDGKDIAGAPGSGLNPQDCRTCHTGYAAFCLNGQCGTQQ